LTNAELVEALSYCHSALLMTMLSVVEGLTQHHFCRSRSGAGLTFPLIVSRIGHVYGE